MTNIYSEDPLYIAFNGPICVGLVFHEWHAESLRKKGYRVELYTNQAARAAFEAREAERLRYNPVITKHDALVSIAQTITRHRCGDNPQLMDLVAGLNTAMKLIPCEANEYDKALAELKKRYGY
jgi:hypothetical protein